MLGAVALAIIALLSSRFVRAVCKEAILYPYHHCKIHIHQDKVLIKRAKQPQDLED
jgi:hypothetical protein